MWRLAVAFDPTPHLCTPPPSLLQEETAGLCTEMLVAAVEKVGWTAYWLLTDLAILVHHQERCREACACVHARVCVRACVRGALHCQKRKQTHKLNFVHFGLQVWKEFQKE